MADPDDVDGTPRPQDGERRAVDWFEGLPGETYDPATRLGADRL